MCYNNMCDNQVFNLYIGDDEIIFNDVINIKNVRPLERGDSLGVYLHEKTKTVIVVRYENGKMISYDKSSAQL